MSHHEQLDDPYAAPLPTTSHSSGVPGLNHHNYYTTSEPHSYEPQARYLEYLAKYEQPQAVFEHGAHRATGAGASSPDAPPDLDGDLQALPFLFDRPLAAVAREHTADFGHVDDRATSYSSRSRDASAMSANLNVGASSRHVRHQGFVYANAQNPLRFGYVFAPCHLKLH